MANVSWKAFFQHVMPTVQGCPVAVAQTAIRDAAIEFCERTYLWEQEAERTDVVSGEAVYSYSPPEGAKVVGAIFVSFKDKPLIMTSMHDLDSTWSGWREHTSPEPSHYFMNTTNSIRLVGIPSEDASNALEVIVALKPSRVSVDGPEFLFEDWAEDIAHGALSRLHAMVGRPWADPSLVGFHRTKFRNGVSRAQSKYLKSRQRVSKTILPRSFGEI